MTKVNNQSLFEIIYPKKSILISMEEKYGC